MNAAPAPPLSRAERALRLVLRVNGSITALAIVAVFLPLDRLHYFHQRMGMGHAPVEPIFEYLARTASYLYFAHGLLCWLLSTDVRRYGPVITLLAIIELAFAALVVWVDASAGMPKPWAVIESTIVALFSGAMLLCRLAARR